MIKTPIYLFSSLYFKVNGIALFVQECIFLSLNIKNTTLNYNQLWIRQIMNKVKEYS